MIRSPLINLVVLATPILLASPCAHASPQLDKAAVPSEASDLAGAVAELRRATAEVQQRSRTDPAVATPAEVAALRFRVGKLGRAASASQAEQDVYAQQIRAQAFRLTYGARSPDTESARFAISGGIHNVGYLASTGTATPAGYRFSFDVTVNVYTLAGGNPVGGYVVGAYPEGDPANHFAFARVSKSSAPTSERLTPGRYRFTAERSGRRVATTLPVDIGAHGRASQDVDIPVE